MKDLAFLNSLKKNVPTRQVCLRTGKVFKKSKVKEDIEEMEQNFNKSSTIKKILSEK
jgi:hypothetical protein